MSDGRPLRQGELDGLCGIYATINAVRLLCTEAHRPFCKLLFADLMEALSWQVNEPTGVVAEGMDPETLRALVKHAVAFVRDAFGIKLEARRLAPFARRDGTLEAVWRELSETVHPRRVAILGLSGRRDHWTVAAKMRPSGIVLFDSDGMAMLRRSSCSMEASSRRTRIEPDSIVMLGRSK